MEAADDSQKSMGARSTGHRAHLQKSKFVPDCEFKKRVQTCLQTNATRIRGRPPIHPTLASDKLGNVCRPKPTPVPARKKCRRPLIVTYSCKPFGSSARTCLVTLFIITQVYLTSQC